MTTDSTATATLDWYGCATFALSVADLTIFLDAYIDRPATAAGPNPPRSADDVDHADWILIGHSHFDHLYGAERIMANTEATLIGSYESIRVMEGAGVPAERMICISGGETIDLQLPDGRGSGVRVTSYPSQHSCVWSQVPSPDDSNETTSGEMEPADAVCLGDLGATWQEQQARMALMMKYLETELDGPATEHLAASMVGHSPRGDGGPLVFLIETPDGRIFYQDTSGHWSGIIEDLDADVAILAAAGRANIDGEPIQGSLAEFVGRQAATLGASQIILGHHDNWLPGFSIPTDVEPIRAAIATHAPGATLLDLDYLDATSILTRANGHRTTEPDRTTEPPGTTEPGDHS
jgi:L-ascorbate metabolism protein UlaG (beta-lactamase superfamily)